MIIGIDLGSTNMKAGLYDNSMNEVNTASFPVNYYRENGVVEFDAEEYCRTLMELVKSLCSAMPAEEPAQIVFTGQAETLVCVGSDGRPLMNAISWMDERSVEECEELAAHFSAEEVHRITGQTALVPTWPATKILWLKKHRKDVFENTCTYMLLKDYIVYCFTGIKAADMSIATFSCYFDIYEKHYWQDMLTSIGIREEQLPALTEPCSDVGSISEECACLTGLCRDSRVNLGTLDHFAGMIGTGNICPGQLTLSTGTVMALSVTANEPVDRGCRLALHYGFIPDSHVIISVAESGGASLEWFKQKCLPGVSYDELNRVIASRKGDNGVLFLPYIVGTNAPEYDSSASGVFWGLRQNTDAFDMACSVMEGVSFLLRKNCEAIRESGTEIRGITATGGGAKSSVWCQMQADITGVRLEVPAQMDAAILGAAMIGAVSMGIFEDFRQAAEKCVSTARTHIPHENGRKDRKYGQFCQLYEASVRLAEAD